MKETPRVLNMLDGEINPTHKPDDAFVIVRNPE